MAYRRTQNRHDWWRRIVQENASLLNELPAEALASEDAFRGYVTNGFYRGRRFNSVVSELSAKTMDDLWTFIGKAHFDMDTEYFDDFNAVYRGWSK